MHQPTILMPYLLVQQITFYLMLLNNSSSWTVYHMQWRVHTKWLKRELLNNIGSEHMNAMTHCTY